MAKAQVVSFDIFDTLLWRPFLRPVDVFSMLETEVAPRYPGFAANRIEAEQRARAQAPPDHSGEVTLSEIYAQLEEYYGMTQTDTAELLQRELVCERKLLSPHPLGCRLYQAAIATNCRIIGLSDMYLPGEVIEEILHASGFPAIERVWVSGETRMSKGRGSLYKHVANEMALPPGKFLHIGDNPISDNQRATESGWMSLCLPDFCRPPNQRTPLANSALQGLIRQSQHRRAVAQAAHDFWQEMGESVAAPLYLGFIQDLIRKVAGRGLRKIYFTARDGRIMQQVYDRLTHARDDCPESIYLLASRRALRFAGFFSLGEGELNFLINRVRDLSLRDYLERIHLSAEHCRDVVQLCGFSGLDVIPDLDKDRKALELLFCRLEPQILEQADIERRAYLRYLDSIDFFAEGSITIVDVGWNATVFGALARLARTRCAGLHFEAYFVGTFEWAHRNCVGDAAIHGYLFENCEPKERWRLVCRSIEIFETFFSSDEGSLLRFEERNGDLHPELDRNYPAQAEAVTRIQQAALRIIEQFYALTGDMVPALTIEEATAAYYRFISQPTLEEAETIGGLPFWPDFGASGAPHFMARPNPERAYAWHPARLKRDYERAFWRAGFYAQLPLWQRLLLKIVKPKLRKD